MVRKRATKNLQICVLHEINPLNWGTETKVVLNLKKTSIMEIKTVFSNGRNTFDTVLEGETITMRGTATIGKETIEFNGQMSRKDNGTYIGDYATTSVSVGDSSRIDYLIEAATMLKQLTNDVKAKSQE